MKRGEALSLGLEATCCRLGMEWVEASGSRRMRRVADMGTASGEDRGTLASAMTTVAKVSGGRNGSRRNVKETAAQMAFKQSRRVQQLLQAVTPKH